MDTGLSSAADVAARLGATGYLADEELATVVFLADRMQRPLLLEGEPGTGKTALAEALAATLDLPLIRLQCYEGIDATQALYDWDFPRQILHLRALEAAGADEQCGGGREEPVRRALPARPPGARGAAAVPGGAAHRRGRPRRRRVRGVPARGALDLAGDHPRARHGHAPPTPPIVVLTSNRTRELHDALKRRCLYHWIDHPGLEREVAIVRSRAPEVSETLARQVVGVVQQLRDRDDLLKPPGRRRDARLGAGAAPPRHHRPRPRDRRAPPSARW